MNIKIIATVGPSSANKKTIQKMDSFGVDYFRINLSHTKVEEFEPLVNQIRDWTDKKICPDTEGAQLRMDQLHKNQWEINTGQELALFGVSDTSKDKNLKLNIENPGAVLSIGDVLNIDFNGVSVQVVKILSENKIIVRVLKGGMIGSNKGIGVDRDLSLPSFTQKDKQILSVANKLKLNTIFLSFCSSAGDVKKLRSLFEFNIEIISKVESRIALKNLSDICHESDSILIDRGDLSRDVQLEKIPRAQTYIINQAKKQNTPVYIATNLMESMLKESQPTRAELNDIVGAIDSGASGLVLAAETAIGKYPIDAVRILSNIISENQNKVKIDNYEELFNFNSPLLNEPHGGKLIQQFSSFSEQEIRHLPFVYIDEKSITDVLQICEGTYSPVNRFMCVDEIKSVLETNSLRDGLAWTLPILLQIKSNKYEKIPMTGTIALKEEGKEAVIAVMEVEKSEKLIDLNNQIINWFGTEDKNHPGLKDILSRGDIVLSGKPFIVKEKAKYLRSEYELTPKQTRALFHTYGWHKIIGFHTRNAPHKGHEYIQKTALDRVNADSLFISPVMGIKKKGDFRSDIIVKCYNALISSNVYDPYPAVIGGFNTYSRYCGPREAVFTAICRKNFGCSHFIIGRDHTGVGNFYKLEESKDIFNQLDIGISLVSFGEVVFDTKKNIYIEKNSQIDYQKYKKISGSILRESINKKLLINDYLIDKSIFVLIDKMINNSTNLFN